jgi:nucleoid DNA-binding protein/cell division septation protein DedD
MTKAELIRKIAKHAGVPDSEAKIFFELLLKKSSDLLKAGEAIFLKGFGHFQLRKGKIRTRLSEPEDNDSAFIELMVYYPAAARDENANQEIIFNVPAIEYGNYNPIDSHFSLSIGRPVIPIQGVNSPDFFIPLTGLELRKLIELRVDKLLKNVELVKEYTKGNEVLVIDAASINPDQLEFNWNEVHTENKSDNVMPDISKEVNYETVETAEKEITWNLGDDIEKEIVEESILDVEKEQSSIVEDEYEEGIAADKTDWNFGITIVDEESENPEENINGEEGKSESLTDLSENKTETGPPEEIIAREPESDNEERFERVRSYSSYLEKDDNEKLPDASIYRSLRKTSTIAYDQFEPDVELNEKKTDNRIKIEEFDNLKFEKEEKLQTASKDVIENENAKTISQIKGKNSLDEQKGSSDKTNFITRREQREAFYSRKGTLPVFIIAIIIIIAIAVLLYLYLSHNFVSSKNPDPKQIAQSRIIHSNIIERDFTVPVTYSDKGKTSGTKIADEISTQNVSNKIDNPVIGSKQVEKQESPKEVNSKNASSFSFNNLPAQIDTAELHKIISFENGIYTVQVSSFRTKSVANGQAAKFKKKGYNAYVEKASVPGKGTWYRVKIKSFKSMREAENFLLSNK